MEAEESGFDRLFRVAQLPAYREVIAAVDPKLPDWFVPSSALDVPLLERVAGALHIHDGHVLLDAGCGGGSPALWIARHTGCSVLGIDNSLLGVQCAQTLAADLHLAGRARFIRADATATGLDDASVDAVMSIYVMMFVDPEAMVREMARVLRPSGAVVVLTIESRVEPPPLPTMVVDYRPVFRAAGFEMLEHEPLGEDLWGSFFTAVLGRAGAFRREGGRDGEELLKEATEWTAREGNPRVRSVFIAARRAKRVL